MPRILAAILIFLATPLHAADLPKPLSDADFRNYPDAQIRLGRLLFYDKVLSGTYRVSCATCHHHDRASSNGFRLDGKPKPEPDALAVENLPVYEPFEPSSRHAPALFNLGATSFRRLFADGRIERLPSGAFRVPGARSLPDGLSDILAVQSLFPAVTGDELAGDAAVSEFAGLVHRGDDAIWKAMVARVRDLDGYPPLFRAAFDDVDVAQDIDIAHVANAIGAFVGSEWRADRSPFDAFLRGNKGALPADAKRGLELFYGAAKCSSCHAGALQTDHGFHRAGLGGGAAAHEGRIRVTGDPQDRFRVRTTSLRNVAFTAPYGNSGAYPDLASALDAHLSRAEGGGLASDMPVIPALSRRERKDLLAFLHALSDGEGLVGRLGKPEDVPSFLELD